MGVPKGERHAASGGPRSREMLLFDEVTKRFGDVVALDGCSFAVAPGQMLGFLGPNGAGKTTAMRSVFGLVRPDRGTVTWNGAPLTTEMRRT